MIYCDIMEKRHREYRWFLLKFDCMDLYTRSDGSNKEKRRIKNQRNEKKLQEEREKEEGKKRRKNFEVLYMLLWQFYVCFSMPMLPPHNIMCSKCFVFLHSLLSCHHTLYFSRIATQF